MDSVVQENTRRERSPPPITSSLKHVDKEKEEIEVFRLTPELGKYYETALLTRKEGKYPDNKYYTTGHLRYVGKFIVQMRCGFGDGVQVVDIFENQYNVKVNVHYTYEGTTAYREVKPLLTKKQKLAIIHVGIKRELPTEVIRNIFTYI
jgi:hypothetical protein